jgi:hypothetical protein
VTAFVVYRTDRQLGSVPNSISYESQGPT